MGDMYRESLSDTIAAVATPPGVGGIAIIRVSGPQSIAIVNQWIQKDLYTQPSHTVSLMKIYGHEGELLDRALVIVMRAPRSFTGEDVVELHCHGGDLVARKLLDHLCRGGARPAGPGEFSLRAFLHNKIDLTQAEAIQDLIFAQNDSAIRIAHDQLSGKFSEHIENLQRKATELAAIFEAWIDFPEDDLGFCSFENAQAELESLKADIESLILSFHEGKMIQSGAVLGIFGAPNVGKSSLMNSLLRKDRAIVSDTPGTTRDIVEDLVQIRGMHYRILDTAGMRATEESIEKEGIRRSYEAMQQADLILVVADASQPNSEHLSSILQDAPHHKSMVVWNKMDIATTTPPICNTHTAVEISAINGNGIERLCDAIDRMIWKQQTQHHHQAVVTNVRHKEALQEADHAIERALDGLSNDLSAEFIAMEMRAALQSLGSILGTNITEDILDTIFSRFCIGK